MGTTLSTSSRNALGNSLLPEINGGTVELWATPKPANLGAPAGQLLAILTLPSPAGTVANGVLTIGAVTQNAAQHVTGTPAFARFKSSGGVVRWDTDIGPGTGNFQFNGAVTANQPVAATGLTYTMPNAL